VYENSKPLFRNFRAKYSLATTWPPDILKILHIAIAIEFLKK
jgi:hypothetical protein